jgi:NAD-specific glutamate dehydrogenase
MQYFNDDLLRLIFISKCMRHFVRRATYVPFRRFLGDVRREFMQRLSAALHGTLSSYFRDALQEGSADAVACLPVPRA